MNWVFILVLFYGCCAVILLQELRRTPGYGKPIRHEGRVYEVFCAGSTTVTCSDYDHDDAIKEETSAGSPSQILPEGVT